MAARTNEFVTTWRRRCVMDIDRRAFLASIGGAVAIQTMSSDSLADSLEHYMVARLDQRAGPSLDEPNKRPYRRGVGSLFVLQGSGDGVFAPDKLAPMPPKPTLIDFSNYDSPRPIMCFRARPRR